MIMAIVPAMIMPSVIIMVIRVARLHVVIG